MQGEQARDLEVIEAPAGAGEGRRGQVPPSGEIHLEEHSGRFVGNFNPVAARPRFGTIRSSSLYGNNDGNPRALLKLSTSSNFTTIAHLNHVP